MNVTNMINKVLNDYKNIHLAVNNSIKYRFLYNGYPTDIFYTTTDGLQNQLLIAITVNDTTYLSTLYFSKNSNNEFYMNFYLPPELYQNIRFTLLLVNGKCSTTPYFQQMEQSIMNSVPVASNHRNNINQGNLHHYCCLFHDLSLIYSYSLSQIYSQCCHKLDLRYYFFANISSFDYCDNVTD